MLGIESTHSRTTAPRTAQRLLVLEPARRIQNVEPLLLTPGEHFIGTAVGSSMELRVPGVAPRHCVVTVLADRVIVTSCDRRTWLNNGPFTESRLRVGDRLIIGPVEFRVGELATPPDVAWTDSVPVVDVRPHNLEPIVASPAPPAVIVQRPHAASAEKTASARPVRPRIEARVQERLNSAAQLVDALLDESGVESSATGVDSFTAGDSSASLVRLLDTVHSRAAELLQREQRADAREQEIEARQRACDDASELLARRESQAADLRDQLKEMRSALDRDRKQLLHERSELQQERRQFEHDRSQLDAERRRIEAQAAEFVDRQREQERFSSTLHQQREQFEANQRAHQEAVRELEAALKLRCQDCMALEARLSEERARVEKQFDEAVANKESAEALLSQLSARSVALDQRHDVLEATSLSQTQRAFELDAYESRLNQRETEIQVRERELENGETRFATSAAEESRAEIERLTRALDARDAEVASSRRELASRMAELDVLRQRIHEESSRHAADEERLRTENARLRDECEQLRHERSELDRQRAEMAKLETTLSEWKASLESDFAALETLREERAASTAAALAAAEIDAGALAEAVARREEEERRQQERRTELERRESEIAARENELAARETQLGEERSRRDAEISERAAALAARESEFGEDQSRCRTEISDRAAALSVREAEIREEQSRLMALRAEIDSRDQSCREREAELRAREAEHLRSGPLGDEIVSPEGHPSTPGAVDSCSSGNAGGSFSFGSPPDRPDSPSESMIAPVSSDDGWVEADSAMLDPDELAMQLRARLRNLDESRALDSSGHGLREPAGPTWQEPPISATMGRMDDDFPPRIRDLDEFRSSSGLEIPSPGTPEEGESSAESRELDARKANDSPAEEFRLLDLSWFAADSSKESDVDDQETPAVRVGPIFGNPAQAPEFENEAARFGRPIGMDDRTAAFFRASREVESEPISSQSRYENDAAGESEALEEKIDDPVLDLRSRLAAMFDLPPEAARHNDEVKAETGDEEPGEEFGREERNPEIAESSVESESDEESPAAGIDLHGLMNSLELRGRSRRDLEATAPASADSSGRPSTFEGHAARDVTVSDVEDSDSVAAYMERLLARNRQNTISLEEPVAPPPAPKTESPVVSTRKLSAESIVVPAYIPGVTPEHVEEEAAQASPEVTPIHTQDKDAVRAHMDSLRQVANTSARSAIATHSVKRVRSLLGLKAVMLAGSAGMSFALLNNSVFGRFGFSAAGWSLAGIAMVVAANMGHTLWMLREQSKPNAGESDDGDLPAAASK